MPEVCPLVLSPGGSGAIQRTVSVRVPAVFDIVNDATLAAARFEIAADRGCAFLVKREFLPLLHVEREHGLFFTALFWFGREDEDADGDAAEIGDWQIVVGDRVGL